MSCFSRRQRDLAFPKFTAKGSLETAGSGGQCTSETLLHKLGAHGRTGQVQTRHCNVQCLYWTTVQTRRCNVQQCHCRLQTTIQTSRCSARTFQRRCFRPDISMAGGDAEVGRDGDKATREWEESPEEQEGNGIGGFQEKL